MGKKALLLSLLTVSILFGYQFSRSQSVQRKPLHEVFTSSTDIASVSGNDTLESIFSRNPGEWTCIKYPMNWPGSGDPYYTPEGGQRRSYYGVGYVPYMEVDAGWSGMPALYNQTLFDQYYNVPAYMNIAATHDIYITDDSIEVRINITPYQNFPSGMKLHVVVVENTTTGNAGTNGETEFHYVMMKMIPDAGGTDIGPLTSGVPVDYTLSSSLAGTNIEEYCDLSVVVFVQNNTSKEVYQSAWSVDQTLACYCLHVKGRVFLQGAYTSNEIMRKDLTAIIPLQQPYNVEPWSYNGTETLSVVPSNMVDWVILELRAYYDPTQVLARKAAILLDDGNIADADLCDHVGFHGLGPGDYYICIYHHNHFPVLSASPVSLPNAIPYDFGDTLNYPPYGGGNVAMIELEPGIYGMIAGDVNKDGTIKYSGPNNDRAPVMQYIVNQSGSTSITTTVSGYRGEDINLNSIIKYSGPQNDPSMIIQNLVGLTGSPSITSVYHSVVPEGVIPFQCGDTLIDDRDGQPYRTVLIGAQCWMAENLNYGTRVDGAYEQTDNSIVEKYCYDDDPLNCDTYGGLYQWDEMMNYNSTEKGKGICPDGWHVPGDDEGKILEGNVDSQYPVGDPEWDIVGWRGFDAGKNLKAQATWNDPTGTDLYGFTALAAGRRANNGTFGSIGLMTYIWFSKEYDPSTGWSRYIRSDYDNIRNGYFSKADGRSIRCIKTCKPEPSQSDAGPDTLDVTADSIVLMANLPFGHQGLWTVATGNGCVLSDPTEPNSAFYGMPDSTYVLVWTISNTCGSSSDTVVIGFAAQGFKCGDSFTDVRDGNSYNTVQIGSQCWMQENLAYLPSVNPSAQGSDTNSYYYVYAYQGTDVTVAKSTNEYNTYGVLYNWPAAMDGDQSSNSVPSRVKGICPDDWHLPSDEEWKILEGEADSQYDYPDQEWNEMSWRGLDAADNLKESGTAHWFSPNAGATNNIGFTALPAGYRTFGMFLYKSFCTYYWSSTGGTDYAMDRYLYYTHANINRDDVHNEYGFSVRCIKDCNPLPTQADAGQDSLGIITDSIVLMANTPFDGQGLWTIAMGNGGSFSDVTNPETAFYGLYDSTYQLVWTISNNCGSTSDTVIIGFAGQAFTCGDSLLDQREGKKYATVRIGTQCWMAQNLNVGTVIDNSINQTDNGIIEKYCSTNGVEDSCDVYGGLYQWDEMMNYVTTPGSQGICPDGWSIPTDDDWKILEGTVDSQYGVGDPEWNNTFVFRGYDAGKKLKATAGWINNGSGTDEYGFKVKPTSLTSEFIYFWTSSEDDNQNSWIRRFNYDNNGVYRRPSYKTYGDAVRCLKN